MELVYLILFFIAGLFFGSLSNRIGRYLPIHSKIMQKQRCKKCGDTLPHFNILTFFFHCGRCKNCKKLLPLLPIINELFSGLLFSLAFYIFGFSNKLLIALAIIMLFIIIIVSDLNYLIIPDEALIVFSLFFIIVQYFDLGINGLLKQFMFGLMLFGVMYLILILGNLILKKESLGGGDVKLMFIFGLLLGPLAGLFSIFLASCIALPFSIIAMHCKKEAAIPFGPFLMLSLLILYFMNIDIKSITNLLMF